MKDVLDIEVAEKEMEFLDEEDGDGFLEEGMVCPVLTFILIFFFH